MSATLTAAQVSVREFLAQLCDDAAAGKAVDRAGPCAACSQTSDRLVPLASRRPGRVRPVRGDGEGRQRRTR